MLIEGQIHELSRRLLRCRHAVLQHECVSEDLQEHGDNEAYDDGSIWPRQSALLWIPADEPIIRGVYANMISFGTIVAGWYCVGIMPWIKHEKWQLVGMVVVQTALIGSLASVGINDREQAIATVICVASVNLPPSPLSFGMVSLHLEDQTDIGVGVGLISTFRLIGGAVATAIYTSIQSSRYTALLPVKVRTAAEDTNFTGSVAALIEATTSGTATAYDAVEGASNRTIEATQMAVVQANSEAYQTVYLVAIAFGALAIASALSTKSVDAQSRSNARAARLETERKTEPVKQVEDLESR